MVQVGRIMIGDFVLALLATFIAFEMAVWFPRALDLIIVLAARRMPKRHRMRYTEEWRAHIAETKSAAKRLLDALGFLWASKRMFPATQGRWVRRNKRRRTLNTVARLDRVLSWALLVWLAPVLGLLGLIVSSSSRGPAMFRRQVLTREGKQVNVVKFRTMRLPADTGPIVTWFGGYLRRTNLDQLPILYNVAVGDMSLLSLCPAESVDEFAKSPSVWRYVRILWQAFLAFAWQTANAVDSEPPESPGDSV